MKRLFAALVVLLYIGSSRAQSPVVPEAKKEIQPLIEKYRAEAQAQTLKELALGHKYSAYAKTPVRLKAIDDPWSALTDLEQSGLRVAEKAKRGVEGLADVVDALGAAIGKPRHSKMGVGLKPRPKLEDYVQDIIRALDKAKKYRDAAFAEVPAKDRELMFSWAPTLMQNLGPQLPVNEKTEPLLKKDRAFVEAAWEKCDWSELLSAVRVLSSLAEPKFLAGLKAVVKDLPPLKEKIPGITGDILFKKETPHGLILIGGKGDNTYDLKVPVAFLLDIGGNDAYKGVV